MYKQRKLSFFYKNHKYFMKKGDGVYEPGV